MLSYVRRVLSSTVRYDMAHINLNKTEQPLHTPALFNCLTDHMFIISEVELSSVLQLSAPPCPVFNRNAPYPA